MSETKKNEGGATMSRSAGSLLGGLKGRDAASLFYEEFPEELRPTQKENALELALIWGDTIIEAAQFRDGKVTIGGADGSHFKVYLEDADKLDLATIGKGQASFNVPPGSKVTIRRNGETQEVQGSFDLGLDDRARIQLGAVEMVARFVKPPKAEKTGFFESMDLYFTKVLSISVMVHVAILAMLLITPASSDLLAEDLFRNNARMTRLLLQPPEEPERRLDLSGMEEGDKAQGEEGKFGVQEADKKEADPSKAGAPTVDADKREEDRQAVASAGILGALGGSDGAVSNIFGPGGLGVGINNAIGGMQAGAGMGDAHGVGGLGGRGTGAGGGGQGLGLGGLGTRGGGRGGGGSGNIELGGKGRATTRIIPGTTTVVGGLDREVIAQVIRRNQNQIRMCYERELQKDPSLAGRVAVTFTIGGNGAVTEAVVQEDDVGAGGAVGRCITQRIRRWRFPEPKGGGQVIVNYPWTFRSAG